MSIFDIHDDQGTPYVVSELLEGETLRARLQKSRIPLRKTINYALQIAYGLAAAHSKGIIHRDLKLENLFITNDDRIKILDFGLAKVVRQPSESDCSNAMTVQVASWHGQYVFLFVNGPRSMGSGCARLSYPCFQRHLGAPDYVPNSGATVVGWNS